MPEPKYWETPCNSENVSFLLTSVDVPLVSEIVAASNRVPLLALFLKLDLSIVRETLDREEFKPRNGQPQLRPKPIGRTNSDLLHASMRLVDLLDTPAEIPFFSDLIHREIIYRLLQYPQGDRLRAIARLDDQGRGTAKALAWLRANYTKTLSSRPTCSGCTHGRLNAAPSLPFGNFAKPIAVSQTASIDGCKRENARRRTRRHEGRFRGRI